MADVRELVTRIRFAVDRASISAANAATNNLKASLSRVSASARTASSGFSRFFTDFRSGFKAGFASEFDRLSQSSANASRNISRVGNAASGAFSALKPLIGLMAAQFSISAIKSTADEMMNLDGRLRTITKDDQERLAVEERLYNISQDNRQALESVGDLYYKVARSAQQFGVSQEEALRVTDVVSKALTVGGASTMEARASILQLGQALGSGRLQGDELRSLDENASLLMKHIADHMGTTVGGLKELGRTGALTSEEVIKAILASGEAIDGEFAKMPKTIGQSLEVVSNGFQKFILDIERRTGVFSRIADSIITAFNKTSNAIGAIDKAYSQGNRAGKTGDTLERVRNNFRGIFTGISQYAEMALSYIEPLIDPLLSLGTTVLEFVSGALDSFISGFVETMRQFTLEWETISKNFSEGFSALSRDLEKILPLAKELTKWVGGKLAEALTVMFGVASTVFKTIADLIGDVIYAVEVLAQRWNDAWTSIGERKAADLARTGGWSYGGNSVTQNQENTIIVNSTDEAVDTANGLADSWSPTFAEGVYD